jgi:predicted aspartyl protease
MHTRLIVNTGLKSWVVIPAELRDKYQWKISDRVKAPLWPSDTAGA